MLAKRFAFIQAMGTRFHDFVLFAKTCEGVEGGRNTEGKRSVCPLSSPTWDPTVNAL